MSVRETRLYVATLMAAEKRATEEQKTRMFGRVGFTVLHKLFRGWVEVDAAKEKSLSDKDRNDSESWDIRCIVRIPDILVRAKVVVDMLAG